MIMLTHHLLHRGMQIFHTCVAAIRIAVLQGFRTRSWPAADFQYELSLKSRKI